VIDYGLKPLDQPVIAIPEFVERLRLFLEQSK